MEYKHTAVWIRIHQRFGPRQMEWFMAAITALFGAVLLLPADTFSTSPAYVFFALIWGEWLWGLLFLLFGVARIAGLFVNGARQDITPQIRVVSAAAGFMLWVGITAGFSISGVISTWLAVYPMFAVAEIVNYIRAIGDANNGNHHPS